MLTQNKYKGLAMGCGPKRVARRRMSGDEWAQWEAEPDEEE